jgi:hypothetical protein
VHNRRDTYTLNEKLEQRNPVVAPINKLNLLWGVYSKLPLEGIMYEAKNTGNYVYTLTYRAECL